MSSSRPITAVTCPREACRSTRTRVYKTTRDSTGGVIERHRICDRCGSEWVTEQRVGLESFLRYKPSLRRRETVSMTPERHH